ncbi:galactose mutarotase isoform X2 [Andrena cerasifolii]|uniref:galactose mutarotase isoform X2 n=1 Tax=Andrena cerasifolii TaxID=2819439 RepID=UPI004038133C
MCMHDAAVLIGTCRFVVQLRRVVNMVNNVHLSSIAITVLHLFGSTMDSSGEESIIMEKWGSIDGRCIEKYTLKNKAGQEVDIITYGATITSIRTPDKQGKIADIVLGFDNVQGYTSASNPYFGATIGRVANRIGKGEFILNGIKYHVTRNKGQHSLHGGAKGWSSKVWIATIRNDWLVLTLLSEDGDEGYPGAAIASAAFNLTADGELRIVMKAFVTKATPINLTNHSYFNLAGHESNATELYKHQVTLNANSWTVTDAESIPTGEIRSVENTIMDLRNSTTLGHVIDKVSGGGYDHNFCVTATDTGDDTVFVARVLHPTSGRYLEVYSNQPGVQFYTSNFLPEQGSPGIRGKNNSEYFKHGAFCLETQNYPDAVNHKNFFNSILEPGRVYNHSVTYRFGVIA